MVNLVGEDIGKYKLHSLLGSGSSACVYLGEHKYNQSRVAVKIVDDQITDKRAKRWSNETYMLSHIRHSHIIRMHEVGVQDNLPFSILDWAVRGRLFDLFSHSISLRMVVFYVKQIASTLQYLHTRHIVHGDIKSTNILLEQDGHILLADFELASNCHNCQSMIDPPSYAAPELKWGRPSPASDQYALGALVYQWLWGEPFFCGPSTKEAVHHRDTWHSPFQKKAPAISSEIDVVISTALARDPNSRFTDIQTFAEALEEACRYSFYWTPPAPGVAPDPEDDDDGST